MITDFEKYLYNEHLKASRKIKNLPYKFREDFTKLDPKHEVCLKKLSLFFNKFKNIKPSDFFIAPYQIYSSDEYFELSFFCTQKAIKAYSLHIKNVMTSDPDNMDMLKRIVDSLVFIKSFIKDNNITLEEYTDHKQDNMYSFLIHFKENRIPVYVLYELPNIETKLKELEKDILQFMFGCNILQTISSFRSKYLASQKAKILLRNGLAKIKKIN